MNEFPKRYNYKNIKRLQKAKNNGHTVYSSLFPSDQKMHPGCVFSLFWQDLFSRINELNGIENNLNLGFGLSSNFYSKLNKKDLNLKQLEIDIIKQTKQNKKFLDKIGFYSCFDNDSSIYSENFNRYTRQLFVDLYRSKKIFSQKEVVYRSKIFQTNLFKNNIKSENIEVYEYGIKYFIESKGISIVVPTTKIETIFADVALAVNPQDKRYKKLIGQNVIIPIINKNIPIVGDDSVDSFQGSGVIRITPGHDEYGLHIAQKHNLPIDVFAIDINGNFTKYAGEFGGKPVIGFLDNIVKYIEDIGNLESKKIILQKRFFDLRSNESLDNITLDQWNIKYSYSLDYLSDKIKAGSISVHPSSYKEDILQSIEQKQIINISNKSKKGILIPIIKSSDSCFYPINDQVIYEQYVKCKSKKDLTFTLIILNLILDNQISLSFTLEQLIDVLFFSAFSGEKTKLDKYIEIYENEKISEYKKGLKDIKRLSGIINKDTEKIKLIMELLNNSFAISSGGDTYSLKLSNIFESNNLILQDQDSFNKAFIDSVRFLYKNKFSYSDKSYENINILQGSFLSSIDNQDFPINTLLLVLEYSKNIIFSNLIFHPNLVDIKSNPITNYNSRFLTKDLIESFDNYGSDVMKLVLLLGDKLDGNIIFDTYKSQYWNYILNKIRNASRYVYNKYIMPGKKTKIKDLLKDIETDTTDYDSWILHGIKSLLDDFEYRTGENKILELGVKIINFMTNNLCDKYLESTKIYSKENTGKVVILSFTIMLKVLKLYIPFFVGEIESNFNIDMDNYNFIDFKNFELKDKNYKINIFMDIVDKLKILKNNIDSKKHESIDIFIQANQEFINFLAENEDLFRKLINVSKIDYFRLHEELPKGYEIDNVININIGAKTVSEQKEITKDILSEMENELENKIEHLQYLKSLITSIIQLADSEIISQKRRDVELLQNEIEELEFNITKLKIR